MSGLYTATMGIISNMSKMNVHSNNVANLSTDGYKTDQTSFKVYEETFMKSKKSDSNDRIGSYNHQVYVDNIETNFMPGTMQASESPLDFAILDANSKEQTSFFVVQHGDNEYLTRNGHFMLDANRNISTANGGKVLDENDQPINIPVGVKFVVNGEGSVVNSGTENEIAKIQMKTVATDDLGLLSKEFGGYYRVRTTEEIVKNFGSIQSIIDEYDSDVTLQKVFGSRERLESIRDTGLVDVAKNFNGELKWNTIERSNADMSVEMLGVMEAQKGVQFGQKVFSALDKILEKEANGIGR